MCLCNSVLQVSFILHYYVKQRTFRFENAASGERKIYIEKKSHHATVTHVASLRKFSSRIAGFELLMNQLGKRMSITHGIETRVSLSK